MRKSGKLRAVIYARVSTSQQEEAGTIETQLDFITHDSYVAEQFNLLEDRYLDNGVSGYKKPLWVRPEGKRLLADAKERKFDAVLVYKMTRLGRKMIDTEQAIDELTECGVAVYAVKDKMQVDTSSAAGKLMRQMMAVLGEFDRNNTVEAISDGLARKARAGEMLPSTTRLGYEWSETDDRGKKVKGATLVVNSDEADLVQLIYDRYEETPPSTLARRLNADGHRLP
jgi:site-specific DNA recombinase